jgi:hypothetical protein
MAGMSEQHYEPASERWNSRKRRWNVRWWHVALFMLGLALLDVIFVRSSNR